MKFISNSKLYQIASAGLRCGRYALVLKNRKKKDEYQIGFHEGKMYAYLWTLKQFGLVEFLKKDQFLKDYRKGKINLFPKLNWMYFLLMDSKFYEKTLKFLEPEHTIETVKGINAVCKKI